MTPSEYIDIRTASEMLGLHIGTLYYRIKKGYLVPVKIGITYYLTKSQIDHELDKERLRKLQEDAEATGPGNNLRDEDPEGIEERLSTATPLSDSTAEMPEASRNEEGAPDD